MLYCRLPDSIEASISRSAHDFYVAHKKRMLKARRALKSSGSVDDKGAYLRPGETPAQSATGSPTCNGETSAVELSVGKVSRV
jgi:hypothetical protein